MSTSTTNRIVRCALAAALLWVFTPSAGLATAPDVYVVHNGLNRWEGLEIAKPLQNLFPVKAFNVDQITLGDYSARQKAAAKLAQSRLLVLLGLPAVHAFDGFSFRSPVVVVGTVEGTALTQGKLVRVLEQNEESETLARTVENLRVVRIGAMTMLEPSNDDNLRAADILLVDTGRLSLGQTTSYLIRVLLQP